MVKRFDGILLEYLLQEGFAEGCGKVVDKSCDTQIIVGNDSLIGIEHLSDLQSDLSLLEGTCKILNAHDGCANADIHLGEELAGKRVGNAASQLFQILYVDIVLDFLDKHNIVLGDVEYEVLVLVYLLLFYQRKDFFCKRFNERLRC